jgi:predicted PurR-regulated permease PerM
MTREKVFNYTLETTIRMGLLLGLLIWCFLIFRPFLIPILWGVIIAVAFSPLFSQLTRVLGGRRGFAATILTLVLLALLIVPLVVVSGSAYDSAVAFVDAWQAGNVQVPPPPAGVADWPVIGGQLFEAWLLASQNLEAAIVQLGPHLAGIGSGVLSLAASLGTGILLTLVAIIIAGVFLAKGDESYQAAKRLGRRLADSDGEAFVDVAGATIRSVATGVVGVAIVQAVLGGVGMLVVGVPGAELLTLAILVLAVIQLPPLLVLAPVIVYVFTVDDTLTAVLFMIWGLLVSASDSFLKPLFLGRGVEVPTLIILIGAIGGMILSGIIGLFVGAVVLALGYQLFRAWMAEDVDAVDWGTLDVPDVAASEKSRDEAGPIVATTED